MGTSATTSKPKTPKRKPPIEMFYGGKGLRFYDDLGDTFLGKHIVHKFGELKTFQTKVDEYLSSFSTYYDEKKRQYVHGLAYDVTTNEFFFKKNDSNLHVLKNGSHTAFINVSPIYYGMTERQSSKWKRRDVLFRLRLLFYSKKKPYTISQILDITDKEMTKIRRKQFDDEVKNNPHFKYYGQYPFHKTVAMCP